MSIENKIKEGDKLFLLTDRNTSSKIHDVAVTGYVSKIINTDINGELILDPYLVGSPSGNLLFGENFGKPVPSWTVDMSELNIYLTTKFRDYENKVISESKKYNLVDRRKNRLIDFLKNSKEL